jgi:glucose-6-phosphate isomerase
MKFDPGIGVIPVREPLGFCYEPGVFGPQPERRPLDAIRRSLRDPACAGPDPVYAIAMDVGREEIRTELEQSMLLHINVGCPVPDLVHFGRSPPAVR